jgi:hypothetical protein
MTGNRTERVQDLRRSNAAGAHEDKRTKRQRTRADQERSAVEDGREEPEPQS